MPYVVEKRHFQVIPRWTCDSSQPPVCPICGKTLSLQELSDHYHLELDKLGDLTRKKEWLNLEENNPEQLNTLRLQSYHEVEKKCPEYRQETYQRVRANRMNRLGGIRGLPQTKKQRKESMRQKCLGTPELKSLSLKFSLRVDEIVNKTNDQIFIEHLREHSESNE
ncbi:hypothetical protein TNCV_960781 [Trichonephila clavipes]|nr:hypothetical protein TNCV_960781 [Trichonephila clavipes]